MNTSTKVMIYTSLIRSIMDYSSILYPFMKSGDILAFERIQRAAMKIIHRLPTRYNSMQLGRRHGLPDVKTRMMNLADSYLEASITSGNPLVLNAIDQFDSFLNEKRIDTRSILSDFSEKRNILLSLF